MGDAKPTRRQVIGAAAVGALLAVTRDKDDEPKDTTPREAPSSGKSTEEPPKR